MIQSQNFEPGFNDPPVNLCLQESIYALFQQNYTMVVFSTKGLVSLLLIKPTEAFQRMESLHEKVFPVQVLRCALLHSCQLRMDGNLLPCCVDPTFEIQI